MIKSNSELFPEAWKDFIDFARNIKNEEDINHLGNYRIHNPLNPNEYLYANCPRELFNKFREKYYQIDLNSPSVYGKIQAIVEKFK